MPSALDFVDMYEMRLAFGIGRRNSHCVIMNITDGPRPLNLGRLWTRHMLGVHELERERRLRDRRRGRP